MERGCKKRKIQNISFSFFFFFYIYIYKILKRLRLKILLIEISINVFRLVMINEMLYPCNQSVSSHRLNIPISNRLILNRKTHSLEQLIIKQISTVIAIARYQSHIGSLDQSGTTIDFVSPTISYFIGEFIWELIYGISVIPIENYI